MAHNFSYFLICKWEFLQLARGCGAGLPEAAKVDSLAQARDWASGRPVVLKPEFSRFGVHVRIYPQGIPDHAPELAALGHWVVQDFIPGQEFSSYSVADSGRLLAHSLYRPTYRLATSASFYFEPAHDAASQEFVQALVRKTNFTGQISFDWMRDPNGKLNVLECNPRTTSGCHLFDVADPLPSALTGEGSSVIEPSIWHLRMLGPMMLSAGLMSSIRRRTLQHWLKDFRAAKDVFVASRDWLPLLGAAADLLCYTEMALKQRRSLREATTQDIEWDGQSLQEIVI